MSAAGPILLLGFEPFEGFAVNPSWEAIRDLDGRELRGSRVFSRRLPVSYAKAGPELERALAETGPATVVAFGVHGGRGIRLERVALNVDHATRPDNDGAAPIDERILAGAPLALPTTLPLDRIEAGLRAAGLEVQRSFHAGTYLCNHVLFLLMQRVLRAGFVHVPPLWSLRHWRGWSLAKHRRAVAAILDSL
jgi:pyroglutamyl-peptidase